MKPSSLGSDYYLHMAIQALSRWQLDVAEAYYRLAAEAEEAILDATQLTDHTSVNCVAFQVSLISAVCYRIQCKDNDVAMGLISKWRKSNMVDAVIVERLDSMFRILEGAE